MLIFFVIQAVLWFYGRSVALQAARDGATQLRLQQNFEDCEASKASVRQNVLDFAGRVGGGALTAADALPQCYFGAGAPTVSVTVTGKAISLVGFDLGISQTVTAPVEQFQTQAGG